MAIRPLTEAMAVPLPVPAKDATTARKRRRRAPAGGASDDCFTCSKRNIKCDRRRPYCSQCLQIGNECSGYKTQLTWGVGVASRGKLRGLSLPIAKAPPVSREPKKSPARRSRANSAVPTQWMDRETTQCGPIDIPSVSHLAGGLAPFSAPSSYDYLSMSQPECLPHGGGGGGSSGWAYSPPDMMHSKFSMPLMTDSLSSSAESVSDVDYLSPLSQSYSRDEMPLCVYDGYAASQSPPAAHSPPTTLVLGGYSRAPTSCPGLMYANSEASQLEAHLGHRLMRECDAFDDHHMVPCSGFRF
ncbi:hypothetical protein CDD80_7461 [Ophiocordyceps camponoti-rufipedis]|uniref:Zn(2)-C6 fungal-type domain-containing protein n=1 Tax=Ophiocordyceps camponoti-rufipedis TaxID=2004952 RepID=A0A2C5XRI7_9HYPO|nr:hypothetical protein CDD80_7461 [Ophiocordyceps camponoti-rufipedis]